MARTKGAVGRDKLAIKQKLEKLKCDPLEGMAKIAATAMKNEDYVLAGNMYKELAQYVSPKLKAVEVSGNQEKPITIQAIELIPLEASNTDPE